MIQLSHFSNPMISATMGMLIKHHAAAQKILQLDRYPIDQMILQKAEDGPFRYLVAAKWDSHKAVELACLDRSYQSPIMKMRGGERGVLEEKILGELSEERCGWLE